MSSFYDSVVQCLNKHSVDAANKLAQHFQPTSTPQLPEVNRYLRTQLGMLPCSTATERECLMDNVTEKEWLRLFNKHVAPTIVAYGLPDWN